MLGANIRIDMQIYVNDTLKFDCVKILLKSISYKTICYIFAENLKLIIMACEIKGRLGKDRKGNDYDCGSMYNCCDCGTRDESGCGCSGCFSCNACEECINDDE